MDPTSGLVHGTSGRADQAGSTRGAERGRILSLGYGNRVLRQLPQAQKPVEHSNAATEDRRARSAVSSAQVNQ